MATTARVPPSTRSCYDVQRNQDSSNFRTFNVSTTDLNSPQPPSGSHFVSNTASHGDPTAIPTSASPATTVPIGHSHFSFPCNQTSDATTSSHQRQEPIRPLRHPTPLKLPRKPHPQVAVPWPVSKDDPPSAFVDERRTAASASGIPAQQEQKREHEDYPRACQDEHALVRPHGRSSGQRRAVNVSAVRDDTGATSRANDSDCRQSVVLPRAAASSPQPLWEKDDQLSGQRKTERIKRRKIEQWAREVRQQAQREHQSSQVTYESQSKPSLEGTGHKHELIKTDESQLPVSITLTYGPTFGLVFGDVNGGRGTLFGAGELSPRKELSSIGNVADCSYLRPWYGLVDSGKLSKEALEAQNALYAYRQRMEGDSKFVLSQQRMSSTHLAAPQSAAGSARASMHKTRMRTDQVRLDPLEAYYVRHRSICPTFSSGHIRVQKQHSTSYSQYHGVKRVASPERHKLAFQQDYEHIQCVRGLLERTLQPSPVYTGEWDVPFDKSILPESPGKSKRAGSISPKATLAQTMVADEQLLSLEEGRGGSSGTTEMKETQHHHHKNQKCAEKAVSSILRDAIAIEPPSSFLSPRHLDRDTDTPGDGLQPGHYLNVPTLENGADNEFQGNLSTWDVRDWGPRTSEEKQKKAQGFRSEPERVGDLIVGAYERRSSRRPLNANDMDIDVAEPPRDQQCKAHSQDLLCRCEKQSFCTRHTVSSLGQTVVTECVNEFDGERRSPRGCVPVPFDADEFTCAAANLGRSGQLFGNKEFRPQLSSGEREAGEEGQTSEEAAAYPSPSSFSDTNNSCPLTEAGDQTYTRIWQIIQNMIASSGKTSGSSAVSTFDSAPASQRYNALPLSPPPREGGGRLTTAQPSQGTSEIPSLDLEGSASRRDLEGYATTKQVRRASRADPWPTNTTGSSQRGAGNLHDGKRRPLTHHSSLGRLNTETSTGSHSHPNEGEPDSARQLRRCIPTPQALITVQRVGRNSANSHLDNHMPFSNPRDYDVEGDSENMPILQTGPLPLPQQQQRLMVPADSYSSHPSTFWTQQAFRPTLQPTLRRRPGSLCRLASRQSLKPVKSDVSMRSAESYRPESNGGQDTRNAVDLSGIVEEGDRSSEDVAMRSVSGTSSRGERGGHAEKHRLGAEGKENRRDTNDVPHCSR